MPTLYKKQYVVESEEELLSMTREQASLYLNDKQKKFCEEYVKAFNARIAAKKAGYSPKQAHTIAWKLRQNPEVNRYLAWLKVKCSAPINIKAADVLDQYMRIAFADITDAITIKDGKAIITDSDMLDGQIIKSIRQSKNGVQVELFDKFAALAKIERYFDVMPKDWRQDIEERKLQLLEKRLGLTEEVVDDGFLQAIKETAATIWEENDSFNIEAENN